MALSNLSIDAALAGARARYSAANPGSSAANEAAQAFMPGGNTRSVLHFEPFPLTMLRGAGADVFDVDGHQYSDFVGEFSAGLYGHSHPLIKAAIVEALEVGLVLAAPTRFEAMLAKAIAGRFSSIKRLRFCNSGTEANILALVTALCVTGRSKILVFREAYHGGVLVFSGKGSPINLPFDYVLCDYNETDMARDLIRQHGNELAAVLVEPILGAAGNIPGSAQFLRTLRSESEKAGALLIFDEIKTSRCGPGGIQGQLGIEPDLTTLGKYVGGGLPCGAFGGRDDIMSRFDPRRPDALRHAGTFNNNVCTMLAGYVGLTKVFTPEKAREFLDDNEARRNRLNAQLAAKGVPMRFIGLGSMYTAHFVEHDITNPKQIPVASRKLAQLFHIECLSESVAVASRGDVFPSLAADERHFRALEQAIDKFVDGYGEMLRREAAR